MSNPAVIKLQSSTIGKSKVWLDDNFGESIHIHIDDNRIDLTVEEFGTLHNDICEALNSLVGVDGFDINNIDPIFLSVMLWPNLSKLKKIKIENVELEELLAPFESRIYKMKDSIGIKILNGQLNAQSQKNRKSNHIGQNEKERMESILNGIKTNGYPYDNKYIILYGDDYIIRDGQHRAACLYYLYGNITVPVMRLYFDGYKSLKVDKYYNNRIRSYFRVYVTPKIKGAGRKALSLIKRVKSYFARRYKRSFSQAEIDDNVLEIFKSK